MTRSDIPAATEALLEGLLDHTVDNRGDVGSWVRKQCLCSLATLFCTDKQTLSRLHGCHDLVDRLFGRVLHAATEKIDKLRAAAGELLECLLYDQQSCSGEGIDSKDAETSSHHACQLKRFIPERGSQGAICWADSEAVYGQLVYALDVPGEKLRQPLFEGFVATGSAEPLVSSKVANKRGRCFIGMVATLPPLPHLISTALYCVLDVRFCARR
ncbi:hypothetical protein GQ54DRAFT_295703, partial [Martensiomyces pterosporus]